MIEEDSHIENVYAWNENFKEIYIGDVAYIDRGIKKKYFCLGCKRQMQAVKPQTKRKEHFRHHVKPNSTEAKCTYRDETYRHYLAKLNAIDLKKIKVPAVYKYSPNKGDDKALLIRDTEFVDAHTVLNEHYIYENEYGEINVTATFNEKEDKYLFIKPDSIFLDKEGKPILIIEFVATHKPDQSKLMKLKRLGIDAIQVNVPKSSPEEIRELFFKTNRTKWLYNHAENETDYLQLSNSYSRGIFEIDDEQRRLFEEGYNCRKAQLGDFIRTIGRILESEHYREVERNLKSELQRVQGNANAAQERLDDIREGHIREGIEQHRERRRELENSEEEFFQRTNNLEKRYLGKRGELIEQEFIIERSISTTEYSIREFEKSRKPSKFDLETAERITEGIRREIDELGNRETRGTKFEVENFERARIEFESRINQIRQSITSLQSDFKREEEDLAKQFGLLGEKEIREIKRIESEQENLPTQFESTQGELRKQFDEDRERLLQDLEDGENSKIRRIAQEFRGLAGFEEGIFGYKQNLRFLERIEAFIGEQT